MASLAELEADFDRAAVNLADAAEAWLDARADIPEAEMAHMLLIIKLLRNVPRYEHTVN